MRNNWEEKELGEICNFQNGFAFKSKLFSNKGLPILRISNIQNNLISYNKLVYFNKDSYKENLEKYKVNKGDLVIAMSGATTGKIAKSNINECFYLNQRVGKFKPKKELSNIYLCYFLKTRIEENLKISIGTAQPNLSTEQIKSIKIPLPPLEEQKKIVSILDKAFEKIEKQKESTENNLKYSKEIFESYLNNIFENSNGSWEEKELEKVCKIITDGTHQTPKYCENGVIFLSSKNVTSKKIDWENIKYIDKEQHVNLQKRVSPKFGDILLAKNGTTGVGAIVDRKIDFDIYVSLALLRTNDFLYNFYLLYFINSQKAKKQFNKRLIGIGVPNLHLREIRKVKIKFPKDLEEQKKIVKKLDELSEKTKKLEENYKNELKYLEDLKKSVLEKAFSGNLDLNKII